MLLLREVLKLDTDPQALALGLPWAWAHDDPQAGRHLVAVALSDRQRYVLTSRALVHLLEPTGVAPPDPIGPISTWVWLQLTASDRQAGIEFAQRLWDTQDTQTCGHVLVTLVRLVADAHQAGLVALPRVQFRGPA